jgi:CPA1 family monovalent cation:H+ antiporter
VSGADLGGGQIIGFVLAILVGVIVIRLGWVSLTRAFLFRHKRQADAQRTSWAETLVIGWAGPRGVVTLAAAFLIPVDVPEREILILAAMVVTAGTLLLQGLTLPALVRALKLRGPDPRSDALQAATVLQTASIAGLEALNRLVQPTDPPETVELLADRIRARPEAMWEALGRTASETPSEIYRRLRLQTLQVERDTVLKIRASGTIDHDVLEQVLASYDVEESMLTIATRRADQLTEEQPVLTPPSPVGSCTHLEQAPTEIEPAGPTICQDCVREGTRTVHLRICLSCGNIGCCNSSVGRHAERHSISDHHPVIRSFEPGESWRWCYVDERLG